MHRNAFLAPAVLMLALAAPSLAGHSQVSAVAVQPSDPSRVWVCNRDNASVSVINVATSTVVAEIPVGVWPRSLAFNADGTKVLVANQRGNVPVGVHAATPFAGGEIRGSVSVIDVGSLTVTQTLTNVGTEPYGLALSPNGKYFAVSGHRSGTVKLFNASTYALLATHQYLNDLAQLPLGKTVADADANKDFIADLGEPRAVTIRSDSQRIYVTHSTSPYVSYLNVTLDGGGVPTAIALGGKIGVNQYPFDIQFNPVPVQTVGSQGVPRFLDDVALSPDGTRALVPHLLHNINHDVNFGFPISLAGAFANRVYPSVTVLDTANNTFGVGGDASARVHHELSDPAVPAQYVPYGGKGAPTATGILTLGGTGAPTLSGSATLVMTGGVTGDFGFLATGTELSIPLPPMGTLLTAATLVFGMPNSGGTFTKTFPIGSSPSLAGLVVPFQGAVLEVPSLAIKLSNGTRVVIGTQGPGAGKMGYRAGHPTRVSYNAAGDRALLLNRGSEDLFLYKVTGSTLELMTPFPPRHNFVERAAGDTTSPLGDLPLGMAIYEDPATSNDDAIVYVVNENTRTLSRLRVDYDTGAIAADGSQIYTLASADDSTASERIGQELFEDASRAQTAGNFNNSCASCHFEGNADGNVWQRGAGPRSTMPVFGGTQATGLILWKAVRLSMGETGPMFGGENGGTGVFTNAEQTGLTDYHEKIPVPLNPNLDPITGGLTANAALGKDLFFGTNDTGQNSTLRTAGCANCHPIGSPVIIPSGLPGPAAFTMDQLDAIVVNDLDYLENNDSSCIVLKENIIALNFRDVNSGVNVDKDEDTFPDLDRNADGYSDVESYVPMNADNDDDFTRDDPNSWPCPDDGSVPPSGPQKIFTREESAFSIPTKLGLVTTGPYMHDHSLVSLRAVLDPQSQTTDPVYGDPSYPSTQKFFNEFHDIRGKQDLVPSSSKVQLTLQSTITPGATIQGDIEAILEFIRSL